MAEFHSQHLDELTRQLAFVPAKRLRQQMDNAEQLYWNIEPDRNYPLEFLTYRITGYRPDTVDDITIVGAAVRHDLLFLVERLSESLDESFGDYQPPPYDLPALEAKLNVTAKTISRYRVAGLFARQLAGPSGRKRLAFQAESVERFLASRSGPMKRAAAFSRIDEETRHAMITRARRITARIDASPFGIAQHLSKKFGRSAEAVRRLLIEHDKRDPRVAIFPEHTPPLTEKQQRVIYRAYQRGVTVAVLADRFSKARNAIYRAINRQRTTALGRIPIHHVPSYTFHLPDAEHVILGSLLPDGSEFQPGDIQPTEVLTPKSQPGNTPDTEAPIETNLLDADTERALFARYNFLKYLAGQLRDELDAYQPGSQQIDRIETHLRHAVTIKHQLVKANQGLVISAARRQLDLTQGGAANPHGHADWVSEGNLTLLQTIETFDPGKGNRFSTYLTWALMRGFAQATRASLRDNQMDSFKGSLPEIQDPAPSAEVSPDAYWAAVMNPQLAEQDHQDEVSETLATLLSHLDERERFILSHHFGLATTTPNNPATPVALASISTSDDTSEQIDNTGVAPQTLAQIAKQLNISAERARQIEHRAFGKLRKVAGELEIDLPLTDILSS